MKHESTGHKGMEGKGSDSLIKIFNRALAAFDSSKYNVAINTWYGILEGFKKRMITRITS